jgi:hypothetical protein
MPTLAPASRTNERVILARALFTKDLGTTVREESKDPDYTQIYIFVKLLYYLPYLTEICLPTPLALSHRNHGEMLGKLSDSRFLPPVGMTRLRKGGL